MDRLVLVLGMHRSGTSVVARSLKCMGVELGQMAEWTGPDNPKGFFEHQLVLAANEHILKRLGTSWHSAEPIDWHSGREWLPALHNEVRFRLGPDMRGHPVFGLKEPRLCRLLPFWRPIFAALNRRVSVVHVIRHPLAIAASLYRRNQIPIEAGLALWVEYVQDQIDNCSPDWSGLTVLYDDMLADPAACVRRIARRLALVVSDAGLDLFIRDFVDDQLRHETATDGVLPPEVAALWSHMQKEASR